MLAFPAPAPGHHAFDTVWFVDSIEKIKVKRLGSRVQDYRNIRIYFDAEQDLFQIAYGEDFLLHGDIVHTNRSGTRFVLEADENAVELQSIYLEETLRLGEDFFDGVATTVELEEPRWKIKGKVSRGGTRLRITSKIKSSGTASNNLSSVGFNLRYVEKYSAEVEPQEAE
ncbi:MAG: hypothetical protein ACYTG4_09715 [Planctomycetota bacterium]